MATYRMDDGTVVDTAIASQDWKEGKYHDGNNWISQATGCQWTHQHLYRSTKGRYYIVHTSQWQGSQPCAEWVTSEEAARWLMLNEHEIPAELVATYNAISE